MHGQQNIKKNPSNASEHLKRVISSNLKHSHSCSLEGWKNDDDDNLGVLH